MYLVMVVAVYLVFAYFFVDWSKWLEYYPTIQFYMICNLLYNFIFFNHTLWLYKAKSNWLNHTIIDLTFTFIIVPIAINMYLRFLPQRFKKKMIYISLWVAYFTFIEYLFQKKGMFIYEHGWDLFNSGIFNIIMFTILAIHYRKPLVGMIISIPIICILLYFHHPLFSELK